MINETNPSVSSPNEQALEESQVPQPRAVGWTLGNSANLVEGSPPEPRWVTVGWIAGPTGLGIALLAAMVYLFGG